MSRILITSALPYVNNIPHLGNLIGSVLSGDVYSRYCKIRGYDSLYVCGTDNYGTAVELRAKEENKTPKEVCDKYNKIHKEIYDWFNIEFDVFGQTSTEQQTKITHSIFNKLNENGYIFEQNIDQYYCSVCERFLSDRYVEGTCPFCGNNARGDQCDYCCKLLDQKDLLNTTCKLCKNKPNIRETKHLFLDLPKLKPKIEDWIEKSSKNWSQNAISMAYSSLKDIKPRCITRDLVWGTPVPLEGYKNKVFYVWFDAPIGYLSITPNWEEWWKNKENTKLVQFIGKDNITFHTVMFPATLIGTNENYTLLDTISSTEYLNYENEKFSKSKKIGVFGDDAMKSNIPSEVWRYYLLSNRPEQSDTVFKMSELKEKNNKELVNNLGNFVNRSLKFIQTRLNSVIEFNELTDDDKEFISVINKKVKEYCESMDKIQIKNSLKICMEISRLGNEFIQKRQIWKDKKDSSVYIVVQVIYQLSILLFPFMPTISSKIFSFLNMKSSILKPSFEFHIEKGHKINNNVEPLFCIL